MAEEQAARSMSKEERSTGRVVKFSDKKGFGFIKPDDGGDDLFVHHSAILSDGGYRTLSEYDMVEFTVALSDNKYQAINVTAPGGGLIQLSKRGDGYARRSGGGFGGSWGRRYSGGGGAGGATCYTCGNTGHLARDCDYRGGGGSYRSGGDSNGACFKCGNSGHFARDCPRANGGGGGGGGGSGGGGACFNCGGYGHLARDCPGGGGGGGGGDGGCYNCGGYGHLARDCSSSRSSSRFGGGGGAGVGVCFNCGEEGHFARDCAIKS